MFYYCLKRILIFVPTLFVIGLFTFFLSVNAPGDPVLRMMNVLSEGELVNEGGYSQRLYLEKRKSLGLDLPLFYFSISSMAASSKGIYLKREEGRILNRWSIQTGQGDSLFSFLKEINALEAKSLDEDFKVQKAQSLLLLDQLKSLKTENDWFKACEKVDHLNVFLAKLNNPELKPIESHHWILSNSSKFWAYLPKVNVYAFDNQFHYWLKRTIRGDLGISYIDKKAVGPKILRALEWSLPLSVSAILITFLLSIPIGVYSAVYRAKWFDKSISTFLFLLYSIPSFWLASLIMVFLGDPDSYLYAEWFEPLGFKQINPGNSFLQNLPILLKHIWIPLFCLTYFNLAFVSRQMRSSMLEVFQEDFIRTARAKGLSRHVIIWKHALKNALLPIVTMLGSVLPVAIGGSIVLEIIFSIPGMGWLTVEALYARDYPVIMGVVMFSGLMTLIGYLMSDILYANLDPRIRLSSPNLNAGNA